jgi:hypothetical protein
MGIDHPAGEGQPGLGEHPLRAVHPQNLPVRPQPVEQAQARIRDPCPAGILLHAFEPEREIPAAQGEDDIAAARRAAPDLRIIAVQDLDEALAALVEVGGDPLPN